MINKTDIDKIKSKVSALTYAYIISLWHNMCHMDIPMSLTSCFLQIKVNLTAV